MSTHRVNEFKLIDDEENEFTIFEYQEGIDKPSLKWIRTGASWFRLSDGTPVNKIDDDTFKVETTEKILRRSQSSQPKSSAVRRGYQMSDLETTPRTAEFFLDAGATNLN